MNATSIPISYHFAHKDSCQSISHRKCSQNEIILGTTPVSIFPIFITHTATEPIVCIISWSNTEYQEGIGPLSNNVVGSPLILLSYVRKGHRTLSEMNLIFFIFTARTK